MNQVEFKTGIPKLPYSTECLMISSLILNTIPQCHKEQTEMHSVCLCWLAIKIIYATVTELKINTCTIVSCVPTVQLLPIKRNLLYANF